MHQHSNYRGPRIRRVLEWGAIAFSEPLTCLHINSGIFSILFSRFLIIFTIILNSFSGSLPISFSFISGEGNGNPPQYACLENSMDGGYSPWGCKESDTTEQLHFSFFSSFIWTSVFLVCSFICAVFLCLFFFFFNVIMFEVSFSQASREVEFFSWRRLNSFFLLVSAL